VAAALHGASAVASNAIVMLAVVTTTDREVVGASTGLVTTGQFSGFAVGPVAFGGLVDATSSYAMSWSAVGGVYLLTALVQAIAAKRSTAP
jgi:cyanate permease